MSDERSAQDVHNEHIYSSLKRIEAGVKSTNIELKTLNDRVTENAVEISGIKGRASVAGMISGMISGVGAGLAAHFGFGK